MIYQNRLNQLLTQHSPRAPFYETLAIHYVLMDAHNMLSLLINNQYVADHYIQFEVEERSRIARSRRAIEAHDLLLQAQIQERTMAI